jgi:hypothetical protein
MIMSELVMLVPNPMAKYLFAPTVAVNEILYFALLYFATMFCPLSVGKGALSAKERLINASSRMFSILNQNN